MSASPHPEVTGAGLGIAELADACGALEWIADALFVLEGRWSANMEHPEAVEHLATHSRRHGWHAGLWHELLPDSAALGEVERVVAPPGWQEALDLASALGDDADDVVRLTVLHRGLVPRLAARVHELGARAVGPGDAALARVARFVRSDVVDDLVGGLALLDAALASGPDSGPERAASATKDLDQVFRSL